LRRITKILRRALWIPPVLLLAFAAFWISFSLSARPYPLSVTPTPEAARHPAQAASVPNYTRDEVDTFYTFPEWYIVWSYQAKADFQRSGLPSDYPFYGDIAQYWKAYSRIYGATRGVYPFAAGDHIMLVVIGSSFTVEYMLKGLYEKTIGRFSEWTSGHHLVTEDNYAAQVAQDYASFVQGRPFYEYSFAHALRGLWNTPRGREHGFRTFERRAWLTTDYAIEAFYCQLIEWATHATYGYEDVNTAVWVVFPPEVKSLLPSSAPSIKLAKDLGPGEAIVQIPRYEEFTRDAETLLQSGVRFRQIAGNELILFTAIAPASWTVPLPGTQLILAQPLLTNPTAKRVAILTPVSRLDQVLTQYQSQHVKIEHLYDY
jgi:hypothetical protein